MRYNVHFDVNIEVEVPDTFGEGAIVDTAYELMGYGDSKGATVTRINQ